MQYRDQSGSYSYHIINMMTITKSQNFSPFHMLLINLLKLFIDPPDMGRLFDCVGRVCHVDNVAGSQSVQWLFSLVIRYLPVSIVAWYFVDHPFVFQSGVTMSAFFFAAEAILHSTLGQLNWDSVRPVKL